MERELALWRRTLTKLREPRATLLERLLYGKWGTIGGDVGLKRHSGVGGQIPCFSRKAEMKG